MSTVVLVAGTGRSGTSLVAGILQRLGVHMGDEFPEPWRFGYQRDFFGTFEEKSFFDFNRSVRPGTDVD